MSVQDPADAALTRLLLAAARELNAGRYFETHEVLEDHLDEVSDAYWPLVLGLIQIAVGYHKLASGSDGAARMLGIGLEKVAPFADDVLGIDVGALRRRTAIDHARLERRDTVGALASLRGDPPRLLPSASR